MSAMCKVFYLPIYLFNLIYFVAGWEINVVYNCLFIGGESVEQKITNNKTKQNKKTPNKNDFVAELNHGFFHWEQVWRGNEVPTGFLSVVFSRIKIDDSKLIDFQRNNYSWL